MSFFLWAERAQRSWWCRALPTVLSVTVVPAASKSFWSYFLVVLGSFGYSSTYPSDSLIRNLARSSCGVAGWYGGVMLLPLMGTAPNYLLEDWEVVKYVFHMPIPFHVLQQPGCKGLERALWFYQSLDVYICWLIDLWWIVLLILVPQTTTHFLATTLFSVTWGNNISETANVPLTGIPCSSNYSI